MDKSVLTICIPGSKPIRLLEWLIKVGDAIKYGMPIAVYRTVENPMLKVEPKESQLRADNVGKVKKLLLQIGQVSKPGLPILELDGCRHRTVFKDMCAECGQDLRLLHGNRQVSVSRQFAHVAMVPNVPELRISPQEAEELANADTTRLHRLRKLVLLVDLDQTLIHTTQNENFAHLCTGDTDCHIFQLNKNEPTLYTNLRPFCREFLQQVAKRYELQIVTFGSRQYAHKIADFIDPDKTFFANRILSRDECINPMKKSGNLKHLFPCGDSMVCIIDDRDDVWNAASNLILVKKYSFFPGAGDINAPVKEENESVDIQGASGDNVDKDPSPSNRKRKSVDNETSEEKEDSGSPCKISKTEENGDTLKHHIEDGPKTADESSSSQNVQSTKANEVEDVTSDSDSDSKTSSDSNSSSSSLSDDEKSTSLKGDACNVKQNDTRPADGASLNHHTNTATDKCCKHGNQSPSANAPVESNGLRSTDEALPKHHDSNAKDEKIRPRSRIKKDEYLPCLQRILLEIHSTYFDAYDQHLKGVFEFPPDVRGIVPFLRSKVLYGCFLVLTAVVPNYCKGGQRSHRAYVVAKQLGASIEDQVTEKTTHLVGNKKGTVKYQDAVKMGRGKIHFVSVEWLYTCSETWQKVEEKDYPIPKRDSNASGGYKTKQPDHSKRKTGTTAVYNPITGKLVKKVKDPRFNFMVSEAVHRKREERKVQLYSSLNHPKVVVPVVSSPSALSSNIPSTSKDTSISRPVTAPRTRKPSMAEVMGIGYALSSNDIEDMDKEVSEILESDASDDEERASTPCESLGTKIERPKSSESETSLIRRIEESSSSDEDFDEMAELLDHEMHYDDDDSDLDRID